jgi:hypothetical protein
MVSEGITCFHYRFIAIRGILEPMEKSLLETNSYLKDPEQRKRLLRRSLVSSFAIEGIDLKKEGAGSVKETAPDFTAGKRSTFSR